MVGGGSPGSRSNGDGSSRGHGFYAKRRSRVQERIRPLAVGARLTEPFASQIRTMVALHEEARLALAPVELRFERAGPGAGRAVLRLVLVDARSSDVRWVGDVKSDTAATFGPALLATLGSRLADLVARR